MQLPGREGRLREPPFTALEPLVEALATHVPWGGFPFAFFGHSMGSLVAFELARELVRRGGPVPRLVFVSGRRAPQVPNREEPLHSLPDPEFLVRLRELNGTPEEVLRNRELMELLLPLLRADFTLNETYVYRPGPPLPIGLSALGGVADPEVGRADLEAWRAETGAGFRLRMLPGDHFFLNSARRLVTEAVARDLAELDLPAR